MKHLSIRQCCCSAPSVTDNNQSLLLELPPLGYLVSVHITIPIKTLPHCNQENENRGQHWTHVHTVIPALQTTTVFSSGCWETLLPARIAALKPLKVEDICFPDILANHMKHMSHIGGEHRRQATNHIRCLVVKKAKCLRPTAGLLNHLRFPTCSKSTININQSTSLLI